MTNATQFAISSDGCRLAFDVAGKGAPVLLLHGGGHTRLDWHDVGYVDRLSESFTVIAMDIRGEGDSDRPTDVTAYSIDKHLADVTAVADAAGADEFALWGFSYGANIGRYLAAASDRVRKFVMMGVPFGPGASGEFRENIIEFRDKWSPFVQKMDSLSESDQNELKSHGVPLQLAWLTAMLDWPSVTPNDLRCPTFWLVGSKNESAVASIDEFTTELDASTVEVCIVEGLDHMGEFTEIERTYPPMRAFTEA